MKKYKKHYTVLFVIIFCICYYLLITYSFHFDLRLDPVIPIGVGMFLSYCLAVSLWLEPKETPRWLYLLKYFVVAGIFALLYKSGSFVQKKYFEYELKQNGVSLPAKVVGYKNSTSRYGNHVYAVFVYDYHGNSYAQKINNDEDFFRINDSLQLLCSSKDPEMFRITSVEHQYSKILYIFQ